MLFVEREQRAAGGVVIERGHRGEPPAQVLLVALVQVRPPLAPEHRHFGRAAAHQHVRNVGVALRRFEEPLPHPRPGARAARQTVAGHHVRIRLGIEREILAALRSERLPLLRSEPRTHRGALSHPLQHVAQRVGAQHAAKVVRVQTPAPKPPERSDRRLPQRLQHGLPGSAVVSDVQAKPLRRSEKGPHRPFAPVRMCPDGAPVEQFDEGLQLVRAVVCGAEFLAGNAGQIEHVRLRFGLHRAAERAFHRDAEPDRRSGSRRGVVVAQGEEFRHPLPQRADERPPLGLRIRPEDGGRRLTVDGLGPKAQGGDEEVEDRVVGVATWRRRFLGVAPHRSRQAGRHDQRSVGRPSAWRGAIALLNADPCAARPSRPPCGAGRDRAGKDREHRASHRPAS